MRFRAVMNGVLIENFKIHTSGLKICQKMEICPLLDLCSLRVLQSFDTTPYHGIPTIPE